MTVILRRIVSLYDSLEKIWEHKRTERFTADLLIVTFLVSLGLIELRRQGLLAGPVSKLLPTSHYYAINIAFSMLLGLEMFGLVFSLAKSVSVSVGKQFEILSLILLRHSFKEIVDFGEPLVWNTALKPLQHMLTYAGGGLVIFLLLGLYYRLQHHRAISPNAGVAADFVASKKIVSLLLLLLFSGIGIVDGIGNINGTATSNFFSLFYTILIFSDVLLVLISLRYSSTYPIVFRNSGFAVATVVIRLALTAPPYINVLVGVGAMVFAIGITFAYNCFEEQVPRQPQHH